MADEALTTKCWFPFVAGVCLSTIITMAFSTTVGWSVTETNCLDIPPRGTETTPPPAVISNVFNDSRQSLPIYADILGTSKLPINRERVAVVVTGEVRNGNGVREMITNLMQTVVDPLGRDNVDLFFDIGSDEWRNQSNRCQNKEELYSDIQALVPDATEIRIAERGSPHDTRPCANDTTRTGHRWQILYFTQYQRASIAFSRVRVHEQVRGERYAFVMKTRIDALLASSVIPLNQWPVHDNAVFMHCCCAPGGFNGRSGTLTPFPADQVWVAPRKLAELMFFGVAEELNACNPVEDYYNVCGPHNFHVGFDGHHEIWVECQILTMMTRGGVTHESIRLLFTGSAPNPFRILPHVQSIMTNGA